VASRGTSSRVAVTTSSTLSSRMDGGLPGRFSSVSPSSRLRVNPPRHRATICSPTPNSAATALFSFPAAQASTILARSARTCDVFPRRAHHSSCSRSAAARTRHALRRPGRWASACPAAPDLVNRVRHFRTVSTHSP
jgi:hypothetical protein